MPLLPGKTKAVIAKNIAEMVAAGHPHDQSVAAALHKADPTRHLVGRRGKRGGVPVFVTRGEKYGKVS